MRCVPRSTVKQRPRGNDYEWLLSYLESRGFILRVRCAIAFGGLAIAVTAVLASFAPSGVLWPHGRTFMLAVAGVALCWAARWLSWCWPSRTESLVLMTGADIAIAAACFVHKDVVLGIAATPLFAVIGAYISFFHTVRANLCHVLFAVLVAVSAVITCGYVQGTEWIPLAASKAVIGLLSTALVLPAIQIGYHLIRSSADESTFDTLTGLLNRRGLWREVARTETDAPLSDSPWTVLLIDVDDFKSVNDTYGHDRGDQVLVAVADAITRAVDVNGRVLQARLGGDEFVTATRMPGDHGLMLGERIRESLKSATNPAISASIGVATGEDRHSTVFELITAADRAMYSAKQRGGNRVSCADHISDRVEVAADD